MKKLIPTLLMALLAINVQAKVWRINNTPGVSADFSDLQVAIDAASVEDTIYLEGTYNEAIDNGIYYVLTSLNKKVTIIGPGYFLQTNDSTYVDGNNLSAVINASNNSHLYIDTLATASTFIGVTFKRAIIISGADSLLFKRCKFDADIALSYCLDQNNQNDYTYDCIFSQNYISTLYGNCGVDCSNRTILRNNIIAAGSISSLKNAVIINNIVLGNTQIQTGYGSTPIYEDKSIGNCPGSIIHNNITYFGIFSSNTDISNNIMIDNNFSDMFIGEGNYDKDFVLKEGSPAKGAADDGGDCGAFGGSDPYVLSGLPAIPRIYEITAPVSGSAINGLPIKIKMKTQN